jgi:hypothetical protein
VRWIFTMSTPSQFIPLFLVLSGCLSDATAQSQATPAQPPIQTRVAVPTALKNEDARFQRFAHAALEDLWRQFPEWAFEVGRYDYADQMTVPDQAYRARTVAFYERKLAMLAKFDQRRLSASNRVDHSLLRNAFESDRWNLTTFKGWEWQPSTYNVGDSFGSMLTSSYAPLDTRLRHVLARLPQVPAYYAAACASVANPSLEHTQLAIMQNKGALDVFGDDLMKSVATSSLTPMEKTQFAVRLATAKAAITAYIDWLSAMESRLKVDGARSFRIGRDLYAQKFAYDIQSDWSAEQLYQRAKAEKATLLGPPTVLT